LPSGHYAGIPATVAVPATYPGSYGTQYHSQDEFDNYDYSYNNINSGQAPSNLRDGFGNQIGSYAYINPEGKEVRVSYTADSRGFRVKFNDLPVAPAQIEDSTPEVAAAKAEFAAKFAAAKAGRAKRQVFGFGAAPFSYPGYAVSPYAYLVAAPAMPVREATLTKVIHIPGHAVSYRVD
jgi:hypothetical protein